MRIADTRTLFGVGIDGNILTASMKAVVSGLLRSGAVLGGSAGERIGASTGDSLMGIAMLGCGWLSFWIARICS